MRFPFDTYGLCRAEAETRLQFGAWVVEGGQGRWTHTTIAEALADREHLRRCNVPVGRIVRAPVPSGRAW